MKCGCGRDYLQVPIGDECPCPVVNEGPAKAVFVDKWARDLRAIEVVLTDEPQDAWTIFMRAKRGTALTLTRTLGALKRSLVAEEASGGWRRRADALQ